MGGEFCSVYWNTPVSSARDRITPHKLKIASLLLPDLSMRYIPNTEPSAFSPDVISDRSIAVVFEAKPAI
jgi:hypothetical protein